MKENFSIRDQRKPGHHWADNEVMDDFCSKIGPYAYTVYMYLARHAGNRDGRCSKSQGEIAKTLGVSVDTISRAIQKLLDSNLVAVDSGEKGKPCVYILLEVPKRNTLPLTAVCKKEPPANSGTHLPLTAVPLPLLAECNKEARLSLDLEPKLNQELFLSSEKTDLNKNSLQGGNKKIKARYEIPAWVPIGPWDDFLEMRKSLGKPATEQAKKLLITDVRGLESLTGRDTHKAEAIINQSIQKCWLIFYPIREEWNGNKQPPEPELVDALELKRRKEQERKNANR